MFLEWYDICSCKKRAGRLVSRRESVCLGEAPPSYYRPFSCHRVWHEASNCSGGAARWPSVQTVVVLGSDQILLCIIPFYIHWVQHRSVQVQISTGVVSEGGQLPAPRLQYFCVSVRQIVSTSLTSVLCLFFLLQVFMFVFTILIRVVQ